MNELSVSAGVGKVVWALRRHQGLSRADLAVRVAARSGALGWAQQCSETVILNIEHARGGPPDVG